PPRPADLPDRRTAGVGGEDPRPGPAPPDGRVAVAPPRRPADDRLPAPRRARPPRRRRGPRLPTPREAGPTRASRKASRMSKRSWAVVTVLLYAAVALAWVAAHSAAQTPGAGKKKPAAKDPARDIFELTRVHTLHLEVSAKEWATMQKSRGGLFAPPGGPREP